MTSDVNGPVAILDKEIGKYPSYMIETFEICDCCGARFGIGYHQGAKSPAGASEKPDDLTRKLREMLVEDHGHDRKHKQFTEIWVIPTW